jgi:hypothetical protein
MRKPGATVPTDFLDLVVPRDEWSRPDLARLLGLPDDDAVGMLSALGYEQSIMWVEPLDRIEGLRRDRPENEDPARLHASPRRPSVGKRDRP